MDSRRYEPHGQGLGFPERGRGEEFLDERGEGRGFNQRFEDGSHYKLEEDLRHRLVKDYQR